MNQQQLDKQKTMMADIRNRLLDWKKFHTTNCDEIDCHATPHAISYLAHCIGFRMEDLPQFILSLEEYNRNCTRNSGDGCDH